MLVEGARITVPSDAVDEFLADWSPRLRGALGLVSSDGSVELPERTPPELVLTATFEPARAPRPTTACTCSGGGTSTGGRTRSPCTVRSPT